MDVGWTVWIGVDCSEGDEGEGVENNEGDLAASDCESEDTSYISMVVSPASESELLMIMGSDMMKVMKKMCSMTWKCNNTKYIHNYCHILIYYYVMWGTLLN